MVINRCCQEFKFDFSFTAFAKTATAQLSNLCSFGEGASVWGAFVRGNVRTADTAIFTTRRYASAVHVYAVVVRPSACPRVHHKTTVLPKWLNVRSHKQRLQ